MENKNIQNQREKESADIFAVAEKQDEATANSGVFTLHLAKPLVHEEQTYTDLTFDFDSEYLVRVCAKACTENLGVDALGKISLRDFNRLRNTVRGFLSRKE